MARLPRDASRGTRPSLCAIDTFDRLQTRSRRARRAARLASSSRGSRPERFRRKTRAPPMGHRGFFRSLAFAPLTRPRLPRSFPPFRPTDKHGRPNVSARGGHPDDARRRVPPRYQELRFPDGALRSQAPRGRHHIINLGKTWDKLMLAARMLVAIENPADVVCQSARPTASARCSSSRSTPAPRLSPAATPRYLHEPDPGRLPRAPRAGADRSPHGPPAHLRDGVREPAHDRVLRHRLPPQAGGRRHPPTTRRSTPSAACTTSSPHGAADARHHLRVQPLGRHGGPLLLPRPRGAGGQARRG